MYYAQGFLHELSKVIFTERWVPLSPFYVERAEALTTVTKLMT